MKKNTYIMPEITVLRFEAVDMLMSSSDLGENMTPEVSWEDEL